MARYTGPKVRVSRRLGINIYENEKGRFTLVFLGTGAPGDATTEQLMANAIGGWRGLVDGMKREGPNWAKILPQLPRMLHDYLAPNDEAIKADKKALRELKHTVQRQRYLLWISVAASTIALSASAALLYLNLQP